LQLLRSLSQGKTTVIGNLSSDWGEDPETQKYYKGGEGDFTRKAIGRADTRKRKVRTGVSFFGAGLWCITAVAVEERRSQHIGSGLLEAGVARRLETIAGCGSLPYEEAGYQAGIETLLFKNAAKTARTRKFRRP